MIWQKKDKKTLYKDGWVYIPHDLVEKSQYDNGKSYQKFEMATYTKEVVIMK